MSVRVLIICFVLTLLHGNANGAKYECSNNFEGEKYGYSALRHLNKGNLQKAEEDARLAIKHDPQSSIWHQALGFTLMSMQRDHEANKSFQKSLELDKYWCTSNKSASLNEVGNYYYNQKNYSESIKYLKKAVLMAEKEHVNREYLSLIYIYLSYNYTDTKEDGNPFYDLEVAEKYKRKALQLNPDDQFLKASLVKLFVLQGKLDKAKRNISEIIKEQNKRIIPISGVYQYLAHIYSLLDEPEKSALYIQKAMDLSPQDSAHYLLKELKRDFKTIAKAEEMKPAIERAKKITMKAK